MSRTVQKNRVRPNQITIDPTQTSCTLELYWKKKVAFCSRFGSTRPVLIKKVVTWPWTTLRTPDPFIVQLHSFRKGIVNCGFKRQSNCGSTARFATIFLYNPNHFISSLFLSLSQFSFSVNQIKLLFYLFTINVVGNRKF